VRITYRGRADRSDLSVPRGVAPRFGARYDADAFGRFSEAIARFLGTGRFLAGQSVLIVIWITLNAVGLTRHWDPYPFILLNLAFSTQAAYAAPLILLAGNRASTRDRLTLEHTAGEADLEEAQNERLLTGNTEILKRVEGLDLTILALERQIKTAIEHLERDQRPQT